MPEVASSIINDDGLTCILSQSALKVGVAIPALKMPAVKFSGETLTLRSVIDMETCKYGGNGHAVQPYFKRQYNVVSGISLEVSIDALLVGSYAK